MVSPFVAALLLAYCFTNDPVLVGLAFHLTMDFLEMWLSSRRCVCRLVWGPAPEP